LGNIYSGQITSALTEALPNWRMQLSRGKLVEVNNWLKENIHQLSNLYDPEDLIKKVTGKNLDPQPFLRYLQNKYRKDGF
jgi:carboxypeptidase Taq